MLVVSILVLVDVPLKPQHEVPCEVLPIVSILVLVDVPLKHYLREEYGKNGNCFNPCFGGCSIKTWAKRE